MDASTIETRLTAWPSNSPPVERLVRGLVTSLVALLAVAAVLVCVRRAGGALEEPLPALALLGLGLFLAATALVFRALHASAAGGSRRVVVWSLWAAPSAVCLLFAAGLSLQETSAFGLLGLWGLLLLEEGWSWGRLLRENILPFDGIRPGALPAPARAILAPAAALEPVEEEIDETVSQRFIRRSETNGGETIAGWLRAPFAAGERQAIAHLAICPPLAVVPMCDAEPMDGPPAEIKVAQVLPYGVRFEIKLDEAAHEATSVLIEFSIHAVAE